MTSRQPARHFIFRSTSTAIAVASAFPFLIATLLLGLIISNALERLSLDVEFERVDDDTRFFRSELVRSAAEQPAGASVCLASDASPPSSGNEAGVGFRFEAAGCAATGARSRPDRLENCSVRACRTSITDGADTWDVAARVVALGAARCGDPAGEALPGPSGCLYVWRALDTHDRRVSGIRALLFISILVAAIATTCVAVLLGRRFGRRIAHINQTMQKFADGDRTAQVETAPDESDLDQLARSVNKALKRIRQDIATAVRISGSLSHELVKPVRQARRSTAELIEHMAVEQALDASGGLNALQVRRLSEELEQVDSELGHIINKGEQLQDTLNAGRQRTADELNDEIELDDLCQTMAIRFRTMANQRSILLKEQPAPVHARSNASAVDTIVHELLSNAIIYGPFNSEIILSCGSDETGVWLAITDAGPGPPGSVIEDVFSEYVFAEKTRTARPTSGGHGLGLLTVRTMAENCGIALSQQRSTPTGWRVTLHWPSAKPGQVATT